MKTLIVLILVVSLSIGFVSSLEFSPSSLTFVQNSEEELCQAIEVSDENYIGDILVGERWEENKTAEELGLFVSYLDGIVNFEESVGIEVCIDGEIVGEYSGELIFTLEDEEEQVGSKIFVVVIEEPANEVAGGNSGGGSSNNGAGAGARITTIGIKETEEETAKETLEFEEIKGDLQEKTPTITGSAVNEEQSGIDFLNFIPVVFIVLIIGTKIYVSSRRKKTNVERDVSSSKIESQD